MVNSYFHRTFFQDGGKSVISMAGVDGDKTMDKRCAVTSCV
jgi:hypothetical protein